MLPAHFKTRPNSLLKLSAMSLAVAALSGCGEDFKDCNGFWDKTFGREECAIAPAIKAAVSPKVTSISPALATVGVQTTFTVMGENLTDAVQVALPDCESLTVNSRSTTQITFSCKPLLISTQKLVASDGGTDLFSTNVDFTVDKSDQTILKGVFVDSVVGGLTFKTETMTGITDKDGTFYYRANETVEFILGKTSLGEVPVASAIHVYDLNQTLTDVHFEKAQKVAQLLQTLDVDDNPDNGIVLEPLVQDYFKDKTIDLYVTDDAFEENIKGALLTLKSKAFLVSKEQAYNHIEKFWLFNKVYNDNGCEEPRNYTSGFNAIDLNEKFVARDDSKNTTTEGLTCDERRMAAIYTNYVFDKLQQQSLNLTGQITKSINTYSEESLDKNPFKKALENSFQTVADVADTAKSVNDVNSAESVAKVVQSSVLLMNGISQVGLSIAALLLPNNENAQETLEVSKDVVDALLNSTACLVDVKHFDVDACFTGFEKTLEASAKYIDKKGLNTNKVQIKTRLTQAAVLLGSVSDIVDAGKEKDYKKAIILGSAAIVQVGVEQMKANPNQTDKGKAFVKLVEQGFLPATQAFKCFSTPVDVLDNLGDCMTDVLYKGVFKNLFDIGFYSVATVDLTGKLQDTFEHSVAVSVASDLLFYGYTSPHGQTRLAAKWGFDSKKFDFDTQVSRVVNILLDQKVSDMNWVSRGLREVSLQFFGGGGLFHSAIEVNRTTRMVKDILREVRVYADSNIDKYKIETSINSQTNGLLVDAKVKFLLSPKDVKVNGLRCYATHSDHHEGNPYVFDNKAVNFNKDLSLTFEFLYSGTHELVCEAYGQYGRLGRSSSSIVIVQPSYGIKWKIDEDKVWAGQPAHFSLESNGADHPLLVKWKFTDSSQEYVADPKEKVAFAFNKSGEYEVTATAIDMFGTTSTYKASVSVQTGTVVSTPVNPTTQDTVSFSISTAIQSIKDVVWSFFDKMGEEIASVIDMVGNTVTRVFGSAEEYTVLATLRDANDATLGSVSNTITVKPFIEIGKDNGLNDPTLENLYEVQKIGLDTSDGTLRLPLNVGEVDSTFPYIWIANSGEGTISKLATRDHYRKNPQTGEQELVKTGQELGRYRTGPGNGNPSRTTVDQEGNVWVGNRGQYNGSWGQTNNTITKVGLFEFGNCIDRNGNGKIDTSTGKDDVKEWSGYFGDGQGFANAQDECILQHVTLQADGVDTPTDIRLIAIDRDNNVFTGGHYRKSLFKVNGRTGEIIKGQMTNGSFYGGLIDKNNNLWAVSSYFHGSTGMVHKVSNDLSTSEIISTHVNTYGIALDKYGKIWVTSVNTPDFATFNPADINGTLKVFRQQGRSWGQCYAQGLAVDDNDNIFIAGAHSGCNSDSLVGHYKQTVNGNDTSVQFVANYRVSSGPTGVAVDGSGNVWSSDRDSNAVSRITLAADPANAKVEKFLVGASPYNYSDMTGRTVRNTTNRQGTWEAIFDGAIPDFEWKKLVWTLKKQLPEGTTVTAYAKTANAKVELGGKQYQAVQSNQLMTDMKGRFIKVKFSLTSANQESTPEITGIDLQ